ASEAEKCALAAAEHAAHLRDNPLLRVARTAVGAFQDFLTRDVAFAALAFVVLYKLADAFAGIMIEAFVIDLGFSRNEYAAIIKGVGLAATRIGGFAGGVLARAPPHTQPQFASGRLHAGPHAPLFLPRPVDALALPLPRRQ